jgi:Asp-tRNA(Asn)/Glu-tRNA(Gln) amidotransferase A subunit family amidase
MDDLHYLSATDALARFRAKELSPVELMEAVIARAEAVEPVVNALAVTHFDEALAEAQAAADRYAGDGAAARPLEGLPVGIKDEVPVEGRPWSNGSLTMRDEIADHTAPIAQRILAAGGIIHARTTTPEFSCAAFTHSRLWGVTRNPWSPGWGVGGSSGGSGASLAAGTSTLASASDIGGSIRLPASFNGVVGYKPPYGRVPVDPPFNLDHYCHDGPMARTVADCALFENVIDGPHPHDVASLRPKVELPADPGDIEGLRVALACPLGDYPMDPEVEANTLAAADALRQAGAIVEPVTLPWSAREIRDVTMTHFGAIFGAWIGSVAIEHAEEMTAYALDMARRSLAALEGTSYLEGLEQEAAIYAPLGDLLERFDVLVCPTVGTRGFVAGDDYVDHGIEVGGLELAWYLDACLTPPFNVASRCPVLAVPSGFADNGVPTGIQIVGRTYDDATVFRAGAALERVRPWMDVPERRPVL